MALKHNLNRRLWATPQTGTRVGMVPLSIVRSRLVTVSPRLKPSGLSMDVTVSDGFFSSLGPAGCLGRPVAIPGAKVR